MKKIVAMMLGVVFALVVGGCGGSDGGSDEDENSGTKSHLAFSLQGAQSLYATDKIMQPAEYSSNGSMLGSNQQKLFSYRVAQPTDAKSLSGYSDDGSTESGSNFLAIDANGNAHLAVESDYPVKVMYSAVNPVNGLVYIALDGGWFGDMYSEESSDQIIADANCSFFEVNATSNAYKCVDNGKFLQAYNDDYYKTISGNQKPIQFDQDGNVYYMASAFSVEGFGGEGGSYISSVEWNPHLYKYSPVTSTVSKVTQDNTSIEFFIVLKSGEVVYEAYTSTSDHEKMALYMQKGSSVIDLSGNNWWVDFFTVDSENTILFGHDDVLGGGQNGIRLVQPGTVGVKKTILSTANFDNDYGIAGFQSPEPRRIIVADDGHIYGVFEGSKMTMDANGNEQWEDSLNVYQILPYDPVPKAQLSLGGNEWWSWMESTPFQISKGYLYYKEKKANVIAGGESLGSAEYIHVVNLATREETTILEPASSSDPRYEIYSWRLGDDTLHFSALRKNDNTVITGIIDTVKVKAGKAQSDFLTIQETASALGADAKVKDITLLKPTAPEADTGSAPQIVSGGLFMNPENLYSVGIEFNKYMNRGSVEEHLKITNAESGNVIPYIPVWVYKTLHMVPDLSAAGLGDSVGQGFSRNNTYELTFGSGIFDKYGWEFHHESNSMTTPPTSGWYIGNSSSDNSNISSSKVAKFAGLTDESNPVDEGYSLTDLATGITNFRVEFSARNIGYDLGRLNMIENNNTLFEINMNSWTNLVYKDNNDYSAYVDKETYQIANGAWQKYRVEVYGAHFKFSVSQDGSTWETVFLITDLKDRDATTNHNILFTVRELVNLDNLLISKLNSDGTLSGSEGNIANENFNGLDSVPISNPNLDEIDPSSGVTIHP